MRLLNKEYYTLEYDVKTDVTDRDMVRFQVEYALMAKDKELFMELTKGENE